MLKFNIQVRLGKRSSMKLWVCCKGNGVSGMNVVDVHTECFRLADPVTSSVFGGTCVVPLFTILLSCLFTQPAHAWVPCNSVGRQCIIQKRVYLVSYFVHASLLYASRITLSILSWLHQLSRDLGRKDRTQISFIFCSFIIKFCWQLVETVT